MTLIRGVLSIILVLATIYFATGEGLEMRHKRYHSQHYYLQTLNSEFRRVFETPLTFVYTGNLKKVTKTDVNSTNSTTLSPLSSTVAPANTTKLDVATSIDSTPISTTTPTSIIVKLTETIDLAKIPKIKSGLGKKNLLFYVVFCITNFEE